MAKMMISDKTTRLQKAALLRFAAGILRTNNPATRSAEIARLRREFWKEIDRIPAEHA